MKKKNCSANEELFFLKGALVDVNLFFIWYWKPGGTVKETPCMKRNRAMECGQNIRNRGGICFTITSLHLFALIASGCHMKPIWTPGRVLQ